MDIETKLFHMLQVLEFGEIPNKGELLEAYKKLKKIFIDPLCIESVLETINFLKNNLFYQEFELQDDPQFLSAIIKKIDDPCIVDKILENPTKIKYSDAEKEALEKLPRVKLLLHFNNDLKQRTGDFYELYSENFNELKEILFSEVIHYKNLEWFLNNFYKLILGSSDSFKASLYSVFKCLLGNARPELTEIDLNALRTIMERNIIQKAPINHNMIFAHAPFIGKNLSPIAKDALKNSLKEYITPTSNFRH